MSFANLWQLTPYHLNRYGNEKNRVCRSTDIGYNGIRPGISFGVSRRKRLSDPQGGDSSSHRKRRTVSGTGRA
ncbi:hypothetical protein BN2475_1070018 [Paraburkholderia ribeironis]|uniref:Uncharacterized protein n=1 Tax=Paraburkholderia ribeironis TaxID=1247936 RepID=A0A1N7SMQ7_9BURK|nr:hypothetical protein BN2475_1070018 [Paraburkholderia ribeironis]